MKRKLDISPEQGGKDTIGYFAIVLEKETDSSGSIYLFDENRNRYNFDRVCLLSKGNYSGSQGEVELPKPYKVLIDGTIVEQGAKVLISFPNGRYNPVVMGCLNPLGFQNKSTPELQINLARLDKEAKVKNTFQYQYKKSIDSSGNITESVHSGNISKNATGSIHFGAKQNIILEGSEKADLLGDIIDIGGNQDRPVPKGDETNRKGSAIYLYADEVVLGHSNERGKKMKVDKIDAALNKPVFQNAVMGVTLQTILDIFVDEVINAKYTGSGIIKMIPTSQMQLKVNVKRRLKKILSEVVFLLAKPDQTESSDGSAE